MTGVDVNDYHLIDRASGIRNPENQSTNFEKINYYALKYQNKKKII
jgi:hypothetical protein